MGTLRQMLKLQKHAKRFAGRIVAQMIRKGCDAGTMRRHEIPQSVYYWTLGSGAWNCYSPEVAADKCIQVYRPDCITEMRTLKLVLTADWFEEMRTGRKTVEYRRISDHWRKRIWELRHEITHVQFSRGYTTTKLTRNVLRIDIGPCPYPTWNGRYYRIYFSDPTSLVA